MCSRLRVRSCFFSQGRFVGAGGIKESEKKFGKKRGEESAREGERVDKANGHFVKFAEQETTRITARVPRRFCSLCHYFAACRQEIAEEKTDATAVSLSSS